MTQLQQLFLAKQAAANTALPGSTLQQALSGSQRAFNKVQPPKAMVFKGLNQSGLAKKKPDNVV